MNSAALQSPELLAAGRFVLRVRRLGGWRRPWCTFITHGIGQVGESGSTTYPARTPEASARKAMATVASIATTRHLSPITVEIVVEGDGWTERTGSPCVRR